MKRIATLALGMALWGVVSVTCPPADAQSRVYTNADIIRMKAAARVEKAKGETPAQSAMRVSVGESTYQAFDSSVSSHTSITAAPGQMADGVVVGERADMAAGLPRTSITDIGYSLDVGTGAGLSWAGGGVSTGTSFGFSGTGLPSNSNFPPGTVILPTGQVFPPGAFPQGTPVPTGSIVVCGSTSGTFTNTGQPMSGFTSSPNPFGRPGMQVNPNTQPAPPTTTR